MMKFGKTAFQQRSSHTNLFSNDVQVKDIEYITEGSDTLMAIFNFAEGGFIVLSADESAFPVLAYSTESNLWIQNMPPAAKFWIDGYKEDITNIKRLGLEPDAKTKKAWSTIKDGRQTRTSPVVSPMVTAKWNQDKFYNQYSPSDVQAPTGYDGKVPNGCVALTMAMIMYYYRYPVTGQGTHTNSTSYGNYRVDFSEQYYNYDMMLDALTSLNSEVAKLIFHCATSVDMNYAADGSGAYSTNVPKAFKNYFKYSPDIRLITKGDYSETDWKTEIITELNKTHPVYYGGCNSDGCHAYVCDGYDGDSLFHFNLGWGGYGNGYYVINETSNAAGGYPRRQEAIINIYPTQEYPYYCQSEKLITASQGTLEDGSNSNDYQNNSNCTYIIAPPNVQRFTVNIQNLKTEAGHDSLSFWKGHPSKGDLVGSFSGSLTNHTLYITTDSLYVTFKTNETNTDEGWRLTYSTSQKDRQCSLQVLSTHSGYFEDGSGDDPYAPDLNCSWTIRPANSATVEYIAVQFYEFDLSPEDRVVIYTAGTNPVMLACFGGDEVPGDIIFYERSIKITLQTDNDLQRGGIKVTWHTNVSLGVNDEISEDNFVVYPNPATNQFKIQFPGSATGNWNVSLYDITGKTISNTTISVDHDHIHQMNISNLPAGFYWVKLGNSRDGEFTKKLVVH